MPTLRVHRIAVNPPTPRLRVHRIGADGDVITYPKLRVHRIGATGAAVVTVNPLNGSTVEPGTVVATTAVLASGGTPSWAWRQVSGPLVSLDGTGATRSFRAPSSVQGSTVVLGVTATVDGVSSVERTLTVTVLPELTWTRQNGAWIGMRVRALT
jgi:hypothetical protein